LGQRRGPKNPWAREEDVIFVHPQNSQPHPELAYWWLLVHSNELSSLVDNCQLTYHQQSLSFGHQLKTQDALQAQKNVTKQKFPFLMTLHKSTTSKGPISLKPQCLK